MNFITDLVLRMVPRAFPAQEVIIHLGEQAMEMFMIQSGLVGCQGRIWRLNQLVGIDMVCGVQRDYIATTFTFVQVMVLQRHQLLRVIQKGSYRSMKQAIYRKARWQRINQAFLGLSRLLAFLRNMDGGQKPGLAWKTKEKQFLLLTIPGHTLAVHIDIVRLLQSTDDPAVAQCLSMRRLMSAKAQADVDSSDIFGGQQVGDITVQELKEMLTLARAAQQEMIFNTFEAFQDTSCPRSCGSRRRPRRRRRRRRRWRTRRS